MVDIPIEIRPDADAAAERAAAFIAEQARASVAARGRFLLALSGGETPRRMLDKLAELDLPWDGVHILQVDERIAPPDDPARNLTMLNETLRARVPLASTQIRAMPVESADMEAAVHAYTRCLAALGGTPPMLDVVHLGLGADGHTASLVPDDPVLGVTDAEVAVTGMYNGHRRMTLTYPAINRARAILWLVSGASKASMLRRLLNGDADIPAGRVERERASIIADKAAAAG